MNAVLKCSDAFGSEIRFLGNGCIVVSARQQKDEEEEEAYDEASASPPQGSTSSNASSDPDGCLVCGRPAGKHQYYGCRSCNSCRAFFRRTVQKAAHLHLRCVGADDEDGEDALGDVCRIDSRSWSSCQACRFSKCVRAGMNPDAVMNPQERRARMDKRRALKKVRETSVLPSSEDKTLAEVFTVDEVLQLQGLASRFNCDLFLKLAEFFTKRLEIFGGVMSSVLYGWTLPFQYKEEMDRFVTMITIGKFLKNVDMASLPIEDRWNLMRSNLAVQQQFDDSALMSGADREVVSKNFQMLFSKAAFRVLAEHVALMKSGTIESSANNMAYEQVYASPWAPSEDIERKHAEITRRMYSWMRHSSEEPKDDVLCTLLSMVMLFSTAEGIKLVDAKAAEEAQIKYLGMLYRYLKFKCKDACQARMKLAAGIELISLARVAKVMTERRLPI